MKDTVVFFKCRSEHRPLWCRFIGYLQPLRQSAGAISSALPAHNLRCTL